VTAILRSNPPLRRLLAAWLQSCLGTGAGYVALLLLTTRYLHTPWAITGVLLGEFVPAIAFGSWFGALADRHSKRPLIVLACLLQAAAFAGLALARTDVPILGLALLAGIGNALQRPALRTALPLLAGDDSQVAAALYDTFRWLGIAVGPMLAAGVFALSGIALALVLNAISFALAAAVIATIAIPKPARLSADEHAGSSSVRVGLREAFSAPAIVAVVGCSAGQVVAGGLLNVCEPLLAIHVLHGSSSDYALLVACYGVGMVAASGLVARRGRMPGTVLTRRYVAALALGTAGMCGSALVPSVALAAATFAATGYANALLVVSETQIILLRVPSAVQGRLFGFKDTFEGAFTLAGLVGAGALVSSAGVRVSLGTGAAICGACALAGAATLLGRARNAPPPAGGTGRRPRRQDVVEPAS
jgi:MFS family permease